MPRRPTLPFDTPADAIRRYLADAIAEVFTVPRILPLLRRPRPEPEPPAPALFDELPQQRRGEPSPFAASLSKEEAQQHARDYATAEGWQLLLASMDRTTPESVASIVGYRVGNGSLEAQIGRELLEAFGVPEPSDRSEGELLGMHIAFWGGPNRWLSGWGAVHGKEAGWIKGKDWYGSPVCACTPYGLQRLGIGPKAEPEPAPEPVPRRGPPPPGMPLDEVMRRHFAGVISPKSELAQKRARLREERAAAARKAGPSPADVAYVEAAIRDALPKGVPSYAKEILSIRMDRGLRVCRLRLFDGEIGTLRLSGQPGAHGYGWEPGEVDDRPFHYDEAAGAWVRVDEDA